MKKTVKAAEQKKGKASVKCSTHGSGEARYVCQHLHSGMGLGVFFPDPGPDRSQIEAWCADCEGELQQEGKWTERMEDFAYFRLVCSHCFPKILEYNREYMIH